MPNEINSRSLKRANAVLLHSCCGPCASAAVPAWQSEGLEPEAFFYNPNIQPPVEYERRLQAMHVLAHRLVVPLCVASPARGHAISIGGAAPARCRICIGARLQETARRCAAAGLVRFATTLAVSPYQPHQVIREEGEAAADAWGVEFLYEDQRRLYRTVAERSRALGLYRQPYCGCVPSKWEAWHQRRARQKAGS